MDDKPVIIINQLQQQMFAQKTCIKIMQFAWGKLTLCTSVSSRRLWHLHAHKQQRHQNQSSYTSTTTLYFARNSIYECQNSESACRTRARQESTGLNKRMETEPSVCALRFILDSKLCVIFHVCISVQRLQSRCFYYSAWFRMNLCVSCVWLVLKHLMSWSWVQNLAVSVSLNITGALSFGKMYWNIE